MAGHHGGAAAVAEPLAWAGDGLRRFGRQSRGQARIGADAARLGQRVFAEWHQRARDEAPRKQRRLLAGCPWDFPDQTHLSFAGPRRVERHSAVLAARPPQQLFWADLGRDSCGRDYVQPTEGRFRRATAGRCRRRPQQLGRCRVRRPRCHSELLVAVTRDALARELQRHGFVHQACLAGFGSRRAQRRGVESVGVGSAGEPWLPSSRGGFADVDFCRPPTAARADSAVAARVRSGPREERRSHVHRGLAGPPPGVQ
mmetsp:Transcript_60785/g.185620  ORF Transcript_60785/g.185620 Transcript_60785/m.185620 type:complete len:257 (-) Transcript_60785:602-1372(-)